MRFERRPWSEAAEAGLRVAAGDDMADIRREVKAGIAHLYRLDSGDHGGWLVTRQDSPTELCLVCGEGKGFRVFAPEILRRARERGLTVRTHVQRRGMIRLWQRLGLQLDSYVLKG